MFQAAYIALLPCLLFRHSRLPLLSRPSFPFSHVLPHDLTAHHIAFASTSHFALRAESGRLLCLGFVSPFSSSACACARRLLCFSLFVLLFLLWASRTLCDPLSHPVFIARLPSPLFVFFLSCQLSNCRAALLSSYTHKRSTFVGCGCTCVRAAQGRWRQR